MVTINASDTTTPEQLKLALQFLLDAGKQEAQRTLESDCGDQAQAELIAHADWQVVGDLGVMREQHDARAEVIYSLMNALRDFATDREIDGGDFVQSMGEMYEELRGRSDLGLDLNPMAIKNLRGEFLKFDGTWTADPYEADLFVGDRLHNLGEGEIPIYSDDLLENETRLYDLKQKMGMQVKAQ